ncbi:ABC-2 type transport system permease protein [Nonomuraea thailandensis]|uniref:ABC-2 type transport system permease protein n=1 Tax=Nonomuraea thailandensis TaxID=1188745 RepID=A0A9X2K6W2_9ACTN|nr:ABC transporter permease [Nonomuraea thailandensis]MCP2359141.1 ABC-2 type transport system permease protein [Nonomuraea thailandensis]
MPELVVAHTRLFLLEQLRVPVGLLASSLFPAISMVAFVVPFAGDDPRAATMATGSMMFFGAMAGTLVNLSITVAQDRELPWNPYLRTLPAGPVPRFTGRILAALAGTLVSVVPVLLVAAFLTEATTTPLRLLLGLGALVVGVVPFMLMGLFIGSVMSAKAAIAASQVLFFPMAIVGGLLLPPAILPDFIEVVSPYVPTRGVAELLWAVTAGTTPNAVALISLAGWTVVAAIAAAWAYRRDEGRRFS